MAGVPFGDHLDDSAAEYQRYIETLCVAAVDCQARGNTVGVELALVLIEAEVLSLVTEAN